MDIAIYDEITDQKATEIANKLRHFRNEALRVFINSPGGEATSGIAIYNALKGYPRPVKIIVEALAASAATLACCVGHCIAPENAIFMIHQVGIILGRSNQQGLESAAESLKKYNEAAAIIYSEKLHKSIDEIRELLKTDIWMNAYEALELGLIDEVIPAKPVKMNLGSLKLPARFTAMPPEISHSTASTTPVYMTAAAISQACQKASETGLIPELLEKPMTEAAVTERLENASAIRQAAIRMDLVPMADNLIAANINVDQACKILWKADVVRDQATPINNGRGVGSVRPYGGQEFLASASDALAIRMGAQLKKPHPAVEDFPDASLASLAAMTVNAAGHNPIGMSRAHLVKMAMTTSDFSALLGAAAEKTLIDRFEALSEQHRQLCSIGSLPDFKAHQVVNTSFLPGLALKKEAGEIQYGMISEGAETIQLATFAHGLALSREAMVNDDLGAFQALIAAAANAAARTECDLVYALLTGNPTMNDGHALFSTEHGNLDAALTGNPSITTLAAARALMRKQQDSSGGFVMTQPRFIVCPVALESAAEALVASLTYKPEAGNEVDTPSWVKGLTIIADPRLDVADPTEWYLLSVPSVAPVLRLAYLNNQTSPAVEEEKDFDRDITKFKIRFDLGASVIGWAGAVKIG